MTRLLILAAVFPAFFLSSCNKTSSAPHARVFLRDNTSVSGAVLSSSPSEIRIMGDDQVARTFPMTQVRSIDYGDIAPTAPPPAEPPDMAHDNHYHPEESAVTSRTYEVPAGAQIPVRTEETIDSACAAEGQTFPAEVTRDIRDEGGAVVIPRGSNAQIVIVSESRGGHFRGRSDLILDLASVSIDGRWYRLHTRAIAERGHHGIGANRRTGEFVGGGAAVGAIIGAIAGHGTGAAIGAGSGAGAGALAEVLTKGGSIRVPVESVLTFRLDRPLAVEAVYSPR